MANPDSNWHPHIVPMGTLIAVFVSLLILTGVTVGVAQVDLGDLNVVVALAVATVKASIVALFFMHLKYDARFNLVILVGATFFAVLFVAFLVFDTVQYQPDIRAKAAAAQTAPTTR